MSNRKIRDFKNVRKGEYRRRCTSTWENRIKKNDGSDGYDDDYTTAVAQVTCVKCLNILIPKNEAIVRQMKANREAAIASASTVPWQTNTESFFSNDILNIYKPGSTEGNKP